MGEVGRPYQQDVFVSLGAPRHPLELRAERALSGVASEGPTKKTDMELSRHLRETACARSGDRFEGDATPQCLKPRSQPCSRHSTFLCELVEPPGQACPDAEAAEQAPMRLVDEGSSPPAIGPENHSPLRLSGCNFRGCNLQRLNAQFFNECCIL